MKRLALIIIFCALIGPAAADDPNRDSYMIRVMKCVGSSASMELYLPQSLVLKGDAAILSMPSTIGWFALDLTLTSKGKPLEPVRISMSRDRKALIVDQYTRGLPPTRIPMMGGTVDFDQRFGTQAKCGAFDF
jgi:hypothetical protein